ncbi:MAG: hypothetical protein HY879_13285 [Deltaproteobacteria bacterium]|nr:hypothetical protein [Deltaproteobacteria bacterium]
MLESKKKMAQSFSDLKVALEKGKGFPEEIFPVFEKSCQEFARETGKLPAEILQQFLDLVQRIGEKIKQGNNRAVFEQMEEMKRMKKSCHDQYKK